VFTVLLSSRKVLVLEDPRGPVFKFSSLSSSLDIQPLSLSLKFDSLSLSSSLSLKSLGFLNSLVTGTSTHGFGQTGLAGALNSGCGSAASVVSSNTTSSSSLTPSSVSTIVPPNIDLIHQRSHSLSTGITLPVLFCMAYYCFLAHWPPSYGN